LLSKASEPIVSVVIAAHNSERYLPDCVRSAANQTVHDIEIIIIDDASTDNTLDVARGLARSDGRIRIIALTTNGGPSVARNHGLAAARGRWIAVLDGDDFMHPERLEHLTTIAEESKADICADDLLVFGAELRPTPLLSRRQRQLAWITLAEFVASNTLYGREPALGYLKPIFRRAFLELHAIHYDRSFFIGEDYELLARALIKGAKFRLVDSLTYFYRKHPGSTSHRLALRHISQMLLGDARLRGMLSLESHDVARAFDVRSASLKRAVAFDTLISALKARSWIEAFKIAFRDPRTIPMLAMPASARVGRVFRAFRPRRAASREKQVCLISRQRLIGCTNGSSNYLLQICSALREDGFAVTLVSPSPGTFGRMPFLFLRPEMSVFDKMHIRGAWRIGRRLYIAKDPRVVLSAAKSLIAQLLRRAGITIPRWDVAAPPAIAAPWLRQDQLYISRHAPATDLVLADYAFATPAIPYCLNPGARTAVVMHDFVSQRAARFEAQNLRDSFVSLEPAAEIALLGQADAVVAIQDVEARQIGKLLPHRSILLTPMPARSVDAAQPGRDRSLLFVGSNTAPNVIGLKWFLESVWPTILAQTPDCQLRVAGTVKSGFGVHHPQVQFLGLVDDLEPFYENAAVVISPLTVGSGLKVKLIEALAHGKAVVATTVSVEGTDGDVRSAVAVHDAPAGFAAAVTELLSDKDLRRAKAAEALRVCRQRYSSQDCCRELLSFANSAVANSERGSSSRVAQPSGRTQAPALPIEMLGSESR
jgi:succinoglycan biosynthesis protein ExoO